MQIFEKSHALYSSKTFYRANFKNRAMTAGVYGHNFCTFHRPELENFYYVCELHRFFLLFCSVRIFQNANWFVFNFSSDAEHVLALFYFLGKSSLNRS